MESLFKPQIAVFHCINTFQDEAALPPEQGDGYRVKFFQLACSSMVKDVYLLRAFEAGADATLVFVCPQDQCRYVEGSIRAGKRVQFVKNLLDEIEIGSQRLSLFHIGSGDAAAAAEIIQQTASQILKLGPNPAAKRG